MKRKFIMGSLLLMVGMNATAQTISEGDWTLTLDKESKTMLVEHGGQTVVSNVYARARVGEKEVCSKDASAVSFSSEAVTDCFGAGRAYTFNYTLDGGISLLQTLAFYDALPYLVARLAVTDGSGQTRSNMLAPICTDAKASFIAPDTQNRMIWVPWDNDGFISYQCYPLTTSMSSYAVAAIYNATSRRGLVTGAVDHDLWKSAVSVQAAQREVTALSCISGYTDEHSHDSIQSEGRIFPHGTVVADTVRSARFMLGLFDDWREGLETFGQACTHVAPRREWTGGVPYGWSSWGVMQTKVSYDGIIDCANFIRDNLVPHGFHDELGRVVLSLDAWWNDNLTEAQVKQFVSYCKENNMIPGVYYGSFCLFASLDNTVPGTSGRYKFRDIALKQNGRYKVIDGAYCLDPTHPGTKMFIMADMQKFRNWGIEYLKCDFMSNGAIEADSWYNKNCYTGTQAYNEGMAFLLSKAGDMYINLSIAPIFPYQYAHGRRISCDAWGSVGHTKYVMNNTSYGWWLNQIYFANDPDHLVMRQLNENGSETAGINRLRLTSGAVTGAFLTGDNFSDRVDAGYPDKSREAALKFLTNDDINEIPRTCHSFRPVDGNASRTVGAETLLTYENEKYVYLAVFNYKLMVAEKATIAFERLGISGADVARVKELWTGEDIDFDADGFTYNVPYYDARVYRIEKNVGSGIETLADGGQRGSSFGTHGSADVIFDLSGRRIRNASSAQSLPKGIYMANGKKFIVK